MSIHSPFRLKAAFIAAAGLCSAFSSGRAATVFSENFGTPTATTSVATYTGYQNNGILTFTGTADVRTSTPSTGYTGASGGGNVFFTNTGTASLTISGIDTSAYSAGSLDLSFGAYKPINASNLTELAISYSTDGTNFTALTFPAQPTGAGTSNWRLISLADTAVPISTTLSLRFVNTTTTASDTPRLDDLTLSGDLTTAVPEPSTYAAVGVGLAALIGLKRLRRQKA